MILIMISCLKHQLILRTGAFQAAGIGWTLSAAARTQLLGTWLFSLLMSSSETSCGKLIWSFGARICMKNLV